MRRCEVGDCFDFNDRLPIHENVRAKPFVDSTPLAGDRNANLPFEWNRRLLRLVTQAALVYRFEHARTGQPMHLDRQTDASLGQLARKQHPLRAVPWFFVISVLIA